MPLSDFEKESHSLVNNFCTLNFCLLVNGLNQHWKPFRTVLANINSVYFREFTLLNSSGTGIGISSNCPVMVFLRNFMLNCKQGF